jgi:hypothetical protein
MMIRAAVLLLMLAAPIAGAGAQASPADGRLGTLPLGQYVCSVPGDATGSARIVDEAAGFDIVTSSSYRKGGGTGTYLLTGTDLRMTSGPMDGARFERESRTVVRALTRDGEPTRVTCVRAAPLPR